MTIGWQTKPLAELCDFTRGLTYKKADEVETSNLIVLRANNIELSSLELNFNELKFIRDDTRVAPEKFVKKGSLLICTASGSKAHLGKVALVDENYGYAFGGFMGQLTPNDCLHPKFFYYALTSGEYRQFIDELSAGVNINNLKFSQLEQFQIPVPPLPEQKRIVAILDEAFEGIETAIANTEKNLANARELFEGYLNHRLLEVATKPAAQTLTNITELIIDCEHKTAPTQDTGFPSIRTPNIGKGELLLEGVRRVSKATYETWTRRGRPEPGDLILAREAPAGNVGVIPSGQQVCLGQRTVLIRPNRESADPQYLAFLLLHPIMQSRLLSKSTGATVEHVNMRDIRKLGISSLPGIREQEMAVSELLQIRRWTRHLETNSQKKLDGLSELKQSILQQAFSGELTKKAA